MRHGIYVLAMIGAAPAAAQDTSPDAAPEAPPEIPAMPDSQPPPYVNPKTDVFDGNHVMIGAGLAGVPDYDGSGKMKLMPAVGAIGRVAGHNFRIRGTDASFNLIRHTPGRHLRFRLSPTIRYGGNRTERVDDPVVAQLGKLKSGFDGGLNFGIRYRRLFHSYDSLSVGGSVRWDLSGRHGGAVYGTSVSYITPLSPAQVVGVQGTASWASSKYADYNYSVSPEGSAASGLPVYKAKGGLRKLTLGAFTARDLSGDFRDGGFAIGVGAIYGRLQGSAAETPITSIRGSAGQWVVAGGLGYSF